MKVRHQILPVVCFVGISVALGQESGPRVRVTGRIDNSSLVALPGNRHPLARAEFDRGPAPDSLQLNRMLLLLSRAPEQQTALDKLVEEQHTPGSPRYHQWLSPTDIGRQFGPADADIQIVSGWLRQQGFTIGRISASKSVIEFSGSAAEVRQAFHTAVHKYVVNGAEHWANAGDPQIPAALATVVKGPISLNNFRRRPLSRPLGNLRRSETGTLEPLFTLPLSGGQTVYGVGPGDFATIYNVRSVWDAGIEGAAMPIAIVSPTNINMQDVRDFRSIFGLPPNEPQIVIDGADPGIVPGVETEAVTDVEWSGAVARSATIMLVVSQGTEATNGVDLSALYAVDNDIAPIVSVSYGACEAALGSAGNAFYNQLWEQAASEGITVVVAAGDNGPAGCDDPSQTYANGGLGVNGLASTPFNVAVGGTDFDQISSLSTYWNSTNDPATAASAKSYIPEMTWDDACGQVSSPCPPGIAGLVVAGSGGPSSLYAKPSWQSGIGVPQDGHRDLPDLSLFAGAGRNGTLYMICESDQNPGGVPCQLSAPDIEGVGGTSVSAQAFAGIMALVNQAHGLRQGNVNPILYKLAAQNPSTCNSSAGPASQCLFYDISKGTTSVPCLTGTPNCGGNIGLTMPTNPTEPAWPAAVGYDYATGLGSVNVQNLVNKWTQASFTSTTTTLSISPTTLTHGQPATVTINVNPSSGSGTPGGTVGLIGTRSNLLRPMGSFTLSSGQFSGQTALFAGGTYAVTAHYVGDGVYAPSDSFALPITVAPEASKTLLNLVTFDPNTGQITSSNATSAPYGSPYILRMDVESASAGKLCSQIAVVGCPTGTIKLSDSGAALNGGSFALNSQGTAEDIAIQLAGGTHSLQAQYSGDNSYNPSTGSGSVRITPAVTIFTQSNPPIPFIAGQPITLSAVLTADSSGLLPTGTFVFYEDGQPLSSAISQTSSRTCPTCIAITVSTTVTVTAGDHVFKETYSGDGNYQAAQTAGLQLHFLYQLSSFTLSFNPSTVQYGSNATITALLATSNKSLPPTGTIVLPNFSGTVGPFTYTPAQDANGNSVLQATAQVTPLVTQTVTASYSGDANYALASSTPTIVTVSGGPDFNFSLNPSSITMTAGQTATTTLTLTDLNGYNSGASFQCTVPAQMKLATCNLSAWTMPTNGSTSATQTVTISTVATHTASLRYSVPWLLNGAGLCAGVLLMGAGKRRKKVRQYAKLSFLGLLTIGVISCGGTAGNNSSPPTASSAGGTVVAGTPAGTYAITITGTANISNQVVTHQQTLSVTVQ